jgi:hypothetical protein
MALTFSAATLAQRSISTPNRWIIQALETDPIKATTASAPQQANSLPCSVCFILMLVLVSDAVEICRRDLRGAPEKHIEPDGKFDSLSQRTMSTVTGQYLGALGSTGWAD